MVLKEDGDAAQPLWRTAARSLPWKRRTRLGASNRLSRSSNAVRGRWAAGWISVADLLQVPRDDKRRTERRVPNKRPAHAQIQPGHTLPSLQAARRVDRHTTTVSSGDTDAGQHTRPSPLPSGWGGGWVARRPLDTRGNKRRILRGRAAAPASSHGVAAPRWGTARFSRASHARYDLHDRDAAVADRDGLLLARGAQEGERRVEHLLLGGERGEEADVRAWFGFGLRFGFGFRVRVRVRVRERKLMSRRLVGAHDGRTVGVR